MDINPLEILKWIGIVLAAGFVGYFGRYLAMFFIDKMRRNRPDTSAPAAPAEVPHGASAATKDASVKIEKKRAKQAVKHAKKNGKPQS